MIDTSVAVDLTRIERSRLPAEIAISTLTLAELAGGPHGADDELKRARRRRFFQTVEAQYESVAFDSECAHAYGRVYASVASTGRKPRGARSVDLMIAASALAHDLPLYTRNASDLVGLDDLMDIIDLDS